MIARRRARRKSCWASRPGSPVERGGGIAPRIVLRFPAKPDEILLSGELAGGQALTNRALALDQPMGQGHVVMFALRPFWRWQTQGTYSLGFNTIINWDHLDAGRDAAKKETKAPASN